MAAFDTTRPAYGAAPVAGQVTGFISNLVSLVIAWNDARVTRKALNALTDRELDDIGLIRGDIENVADGHAKLAFRCAGVPGTGKAARPEPGSRLFYWIDGKY